MAGQLVLSYPFSVDYNNNRLSTVNSDTDTYKAQQITSFLRTEKGERPLFKNFGIIDPVFNQFDSAEFIDAFIDFYPSNRIEITGIQITDNAGAATNVAVEFN